MENINFVKKFKEGDKVIILFTKEITTVKRVVKTGYYNYILNNHSGFFVAEEIKKIK